jgi:hypothetical protein
MVLGLVVVVLIAVFIAQRNIALELRSAYAKLSDTNLLAFMSDSGSASPKRDRGSRQPSPYSPSYSPSAAGRFSRSGAPVVPVTGSELLATAKDSHSLRRVLTSSASAKNLKRDKSFNSSSNGSIKINSQPVSPAAAQPPSTMLFSHTTGSTGLASLGLGPKRFASTTGSMADAAVDLEAGADVGIGAVVPISSEGAKKLHDTLSPLNISKLTEQSTSSGDWNLRTLREESASATASMTASHSRTAQVL